MSLIFEFLKDSKVFYPEPKIGRGRPEKVTNKPQTTSPPPSPKPGLKLDNIVVSTLDSWNSALQEARSAGKCGFDLETTSLDPLSGKVRLVQLALPDGRVYVADLFQTDGGAMLEALVPFVEDPAALKIGHNLKFDLAWIARAVSRRLKPRNIFDTMIASQLTTAGYYWQVKAPEGSKSMWKKERFSHSLKDLTLRHLGKELDKDLQVSDWAGSSISHEQIRYAAEDAAVLIPLQEILAELLQKNQLEEVAKVEFNVIPSIVEIELSGLPIDIRAAKALLDEKEEKTASILSKIQADAQSAGFVPRPKKGKKPSDLLNPGSHMDVLDYLRHLGYEVKETGEIALKELVEQGCTAASHLLQYRRVTGQVKFLKEWLLKLSPVDERLHPSYFQLGADSGRITSREPSGQQIPKRGEDGQQLRQLFRAPEGKKLIKADFSGIELRIMAFLSKDETMISAFKEGQDLHKLTASKISGVPLHEVTKEQRQGAKAVNFLLIYGGQPPLLQKRAKADYGVEMTLDEANEAQKTFFRSYSRIERWHNMQRLHRKNRRDHWYHSHDQGFHIKRLTVTETVLNRRRVWGSGLIGNASLASVNQLYNSPVQGTGADLLKISTAEVYDILPPEARMIATVHDEIVLEVDAAVAEDLAQKVKATMEEVGSKLLSPVPVEVEVDVVDTWGGNLLEVEKVGAVNSLQADPTAFVEDGTGTIALSDEVEPVYEPLPAVDEEAMI
jgi:DNA polymerase-1